MEPAIRSVSGPEAWGFAEVAQVFGVIVLAVVLVSLIVYWLRSESDPRHDVDPGYMAALRRARRRLVTDGDHERDRLWRPTGGPGGGDGSG